MERGIYFDGWYRGEHCYHPSLPMRRRQMIEDLEAFRGTMLVWSALGGGVISLPYLENEAFGRVDPRLRFYGYMNDAEFIAECDKRGIKVFGIVFEVQGWEFPAEFSADESELLGLNITRGVGKPGWYGLREFSQNRYPKLFPKKWHDYFPEGLYNSEGKEVEDLWEECATRDFNGKPCHAAWVEVKGENQICYQMCRNNPVWRIYLKKIIEIQIDAGVHGVELDECELPITSIGYGGCFCKDCMKQFREYLKELREAGILPTGLNEIELETFDYGQYLKEKKVDYRGDLSQVPFFHEYFMFQMKAITKYFAELCDYVKEYGKRSGREVLVSGNFFNLLPQYMPLEPKVDIVITEMRQNLYKQANWYRYAAGFAREKPLIVVENPYGGIIPELLELIKEGKGYDLFRLFLLEAAAFGCNMAVPYGGWMGNEIKDAFYPPYQVTKEVQDFLAEKQHLYSTRSGAEIAVIFNYGSYYWREVDRVYNEYANIDDDAGLLSYTLIDEEDPSVPRLPFWDVTKGLSDLQVPYDVLITGDGKVVADNFTFEMIEEYQVVIVPDCYELTKNQVNIFRHFLEKDGKIIIYGRFAQNLSHEIRDEVLAHNNSTVYGDMTCFTAGSPQFTQMIREGVGGDFQLKFNPTSDIGANIQTIEGGTAVHIINYSYSKKLDAVKPLERLEFTVRLGHPVNKVILHTLDESKVACENWSDGTTTTVVLQKVPLYMVVELIS